MDGPNEIGDWKKILELGSGAFGIVSLWKNSANNDCIGKNFNVFFLNSVPSLNYCFYFLCSCKKVQVQNEYKFNRQTETSME